jgi:hypothetical protein
MLLIHLLRAVLDGSVHLLKGAGTRHLLIDNFKEDKQGRMLIAPRRTARLLLPLLVNVFLWDELVQPSCAIAARSSSSLDDGYNWCGACASLERVLELALL